jgi:hypothetical protein
MPAPRRCLRQSKAPARMLSWRSGPTGSCCSRADEVRERGPIVLTRLFIWEGGVVLPGLPVTPCFAVENVGLVAGPSWAATLARAARAG